MTGKYENRVVFFLLQHSAVGGLKICVWIFCFSVSELLIFFNFDLTHSVFGFSFRIMYQVPWRKNWKHSLNSAEKKFVAFER